MVSQLNNDILLKVDELLSLIKESPIYQKYLLLQEKMENNIELKSLINEVRSLQKEIVNGYHKEDILNEKMKLLEDNPLYREYNNTLSEINNLFTIIENTLNNYFDKKFNQE